MRVIKLKNNTDTAEYWVGVLIHPGETYQLQNDIELGLASTNVKVNSDIWSTPTRIVINDGNSDLSPKAGSDWLNGIDSSPKDSDSAALSRVKASSMGWTYEHQSFEFTTSQLGSMNHKRYDLTEFGFCIVKFYKDESGTECIDQTDADANCIKTVVDWEPTHDYELIGGSANWESILSSDVYLWIVGVPDIPYAYGGTKEMIVNCCLKRYENRVVSIDGRATKRLNYNSIYHTNKMRFILRHPAGFKFNPQINMEFYKL
jgi:hypothetical protein